MALQGLCSSFSTALKSILSPVKNDESLGVKQAIILYYRALPVPILAMLLVSSLDLLLAQFEYAASTFWSPSLSDSTGLGSSDSILTPVFALACLVLYPLTAFLNTALIHWVSKYILRIWQGSYARTFAAVIFGMLPIAMGFWLLSIPLVNLPVSAVTNLMFLGMCLWSAVVTVISLRVQHRTTQGRALVGYAVGMILVFFTMTFYYNFTITTTITLNTIEAIFR